MILSGAMQKMTTWLCLFLSLSLIVTILMYANSRATVKNQDATITNLKEANRTNLETIATLVHESELQANLLAQAQQRQQNILIGYRATLTQLQDILDEDKTARDWSAQPLPASIAGLLDAAEKR